MPWTKPDEVADRPPARSILPARPDAAGVGAGARLWVGTCGFSYTDWTEAGFYPSGTKAARMLAWYAKHFPITELNHTWYETPKADVLERQLAQAPAGFRFAVKLHRGLTEDVDPNRWRRQAAAFRHGIAPLIQSGSLASVLIQLPASFDRSVENRRHLAALLEELDGLPLAVEFRQGSWNADRVFEELARRSVTLVVVDEPDLPGLFPPLSVVTNPDLFYVRFHGRNPRGWRSGRKQVQFDYSYSEEELREWIENRIALMARQARDGVIVFNNYVRAQAVRNAQVLVRLLREYGFLVAEL
jgi:uncharacterized protein YecE (DUF72 family)